MEVYIVYHMQADVKYVEKLFTTYKGAESFATKYNKEHKNGDYDYCYASVAPVDVKG